MPSLLGRIVHERYAIHWEKLGMKLGLADHHINMISDNNKYNPNRVEDCCTAMLKQWLKEVPLPTWGKLNDAIKEVEAPNCIPETGMYITFMLTNISYICRCFEKQVDVMPSKSQALAIRLSYSIVNLLRLLQIHHKIM